MKMISREAWSKRHGDFDWCLFSSLFSPPTCLKISSQAASLSGKSKISPAVAAINLFVVAEAVVEFVYQSRRFMFLSFWFS